jgi:hypothetical protein
MSCGINVGNQAVLLKGINEKGVYIREPQGTNNNNPKYT